MLETALPVFHSILCGKLERVNDAEGRLPCFSFPDPLQELTAAQKQETWDRIGVFTDQLLYYPSSDDDGCNEFCRRSSDFVFKPGSNFAGCVCQIHISTPELYQPLVDACNDKADIVQRQYWQWNLASTMLHELAHAAEKAVTQHDGHFFLGRQGQTSEMGFELEAWLFGGVTPSRSCPQSRAYRYAETGEYSKLPYQIAVKDYPCPALHESYDSYASRYNGTNTAINWNTKFPHTNDMFQDQFWDLDVQVRGRQALFFKRETGMMLRLNDNMQLLPLVPHPDETLDVPKGFWLDKNGLIRKKVDKLVKMEVSQSRQVERQIRVNNIVASGVMQTEWKPVSLGEKADAWRHKIVKDVKQKAVDTAMHAKQKTHETTKEVKEVTQETTKKVKEKATDTIQGAGGIWELTELNLRVAANMVKGKGY